MPRKVIPRKVNFFPETTYFKPQGVPLSQLKEVALGMDELEALRLADFENKNQTEAAKKMGISQSTFQRILKKARKKTAEALVLGKAIAVKGGETQMRFRKRARGRGGGKIIGRGRRGGFGLGPGGVCVCINPECQYEISHQAKVPCYQMRCPKCGSPMIRR